MTSRMWNADQIEMLAKLPAKKRDEFVRARCDEADAEMLVGIMNDAIEGGLDAAQAETRVNEHCNSRRNNATLVTSVGFAGGAGLGGADILQVGNEAANKIAAHVAVTAWMDILAGGVAAVLLGCGLAGTLRLRALRRQRNVLRSCARSLVSQVSSQ